MVGEVTRESDCERRHHHDVERIHALRRSTARTGDQRVVLRRHRRFWWRPGARRSRPKRGVSQVDAVHRMTDIDGGGR